MSTPAIQWYPGHIAKAEQQLKRHLDKVDLVIEVRDARIPMATGHPHLNRWLKGKQHLLVINRRDMVTPRRGQLAAVVQDTGQRTVWCDAKAGTGVKQVQQAAIRSGDQLNERRRTRGMRPRPVRALTLGFPNVGKSARSIVWSSRRWWPVPGGPASPAPCAGSGSDRIWICSMLPVCCRPGSMISRLPFGLRSAMTLARRPMTVSWWPRHFCSC